MHAGAFTYLKTSQRVVPLAMLCYYTSSEIMMIYQCSRASLLLWRAADAHALVLEATPIFKRRARFDTALVDIDAEVV